MTQHEKLSERLKSITLPKTKNQAFQARLRLKLEKIAKKPVPAPKEKIIPISKIIWGLSAAAVAACLIVTLILINPKTWQGSQAARADKYNGSDAIPALLPAAFSGSVTIQDKEGFHPVVLEKIPHVPVTVSVADNFILFQIDQSAMIMLDAGAFVAFEKPEHQDNKRRIKIFLVSGRVFVRTLTPDAPAISVETDTVICRARGTVFMVEKDGETGTTIAVNEGMVEVEPVLWNREKLTRPITGGAEILFYKNGGSTPLQSIAENNLARFQRFQKNRLVFVIGSDDVVKITVKSEPAEALITTNKGFQGKGNISFITEAKSPILITAELTGYRRISTLVNPGGDTDLVLILEKDDFPPNGRTPPGVKGYR